MSGVNVGIEIHGLDRLADRLARLSSLNHALMLEALGATVESQTRRRITSEKTSPDGAAWKPNRAGTSILVRRGGLRDSIHYRTGASEVRIGSGLVYAAIHQFGGTIRPKAARKLVFPGSGGGLVFADQVTIPARPYLGVSAANRVELERVLLTAIGQLLN
ncbi:MAG: phage virion morphogenesis protein [Hyphomicrobiaceae bacterium]|nr:phage virion morphogenesis protein [Hyphomicrobiaceae bacterium]